MLSEVEIKRSDIVWLKLPQSLAPMEKAIQEPHKIRPFIILSNSLNLKIDYNRVCTQDKPIFGMDCTSQKHLVDGRPYIAFNMPGHQDKETYALLDSVRDISSYQQKIRVNHHLPKPDEENLLNGLADVLKPEQKFFLRALFNKKSQCLPGQIWRIKNINADGEALVLLRRGRFVSSCTVEDSHDVDYNTQKLRHTPYLVAYFKNRTDVKNLRNLRWDDLQIMAIQEQSFQYKTAELTPETSGILLNNIRERAGLTPIEYKQPAFRNLFNPAVFLRLLASPVMR